MKISHLCLSCFYIDGYSYQENILPCINKNDGHSVRIIASTETYLDGKTLGYKLPGSYVNEDGIAVTRLDYRKFLPHSIMKKLRMHKGVFELLEEFNPDVILFHGLCGWEMTAIAKYKKHHPKVKIYADSHEDANNSGRGFISRFFLHKLYYRSILHFALPYIDRILYITPETREFVKNVYGVPEDVLEFYPLGGHVFSDEEYVETRKKTRSLLKVDEDDVIFIQAGKMGKKKKVIESMEAFHAVKNKKFKLFFIGSLETGIKEQFDLLLEKDDRISYLGWKESSELMHYLCAADVYLQPGSQSAIMQNALCLRCPVILDDVLSHEPYVKGNGWLLNNFTTLVDVLKEISQFPGKLPDMSTVSVEIARDLLDYKKLASRLYQ